MLTPDVTPIQPINVIIHQDGGMSELAKTLISALTGALAAIIVAFVIDWIKRLILKREMREHIALELMENLSVAERADLMLSGAANEPEGEKQRVVKWARALARLVNSDMFDYYLAEHRSLVYKIDKKKKARGFYEALKNALPKYGRNFNELSTDYSVAIAMGFAYLDDQKIEFVRSKETLADLLKLTTDDKGEEEGNKK
jgi:hypothetical protein